jgi:hypothetical protein
MFKCGLCGRMTIPNEKATHVVTETRKVKYPCNTEGTEIAKEVLACRQCAIARAEQKAE